LGNDGRVRDTKGVADSSWGKTEEGRATRKFMDKGGDPWGFRQGRSEGSIGGGRRVGVGERVAAFEGTAIKKRGAEKEEEKKTVRKKKIEQRQDKGGDHWTLAGERKT